MTVPPRLSSAPGAHLGLATLGDAALYFIAPDASPQRLLDVGKPLAPLIYLGCSRGRETTRDHLSELLWSNLERDRARNGLRQTLWQVKTRVCDNLLSATRSHYPHRTDRG